MNWTDQQISLRRQTGLLGRSVIIKVLVLVLLLAPVLHLAGDGRVGSLPNSNVHASYLCSVTGLAPTPLAVSPVTAITRVPETPITTYRGFPTDLPIIRPFCLILPHFITSVN
jgi:hypothetical protein